MITVNLNQTNPIIIIGLGEMGGVFARGFLKLGHPVYPVTREMNLTDSVNSTLEPLLVIVAVAENELQNVLAQIPSEWRDRLVLLQNELLPKDWESHGLSEPTIISVWFEKKTGQDAKVIIPSPVFGPHASLIKQALGKLEIPANELTSKEDLFFELVRKNLYILTTNIAGLQCGGTVADLWRNHRTLATAIADDVIAIQEKLTGTSLDRDRLIAGMVEAFEGDPDHNCMGRSAPARLQRALDISDKHNLLSVSLKSIASTS